jgi:hypothetical protein
MTTGALIFAFNNESIDYVAMAAWSAHNIHRHLGIPVCLVTDSDVSGPWDHVIQVSRSQTTSQRYFEDLEHAVTWYNHDRVDAYALTPWDQTLVLDADYVVASSQLVDMLQAKHDFLCHRKAYDVTDPGRELTGLNYFGDKQQPMSWATVMLFKRSSMARDIFACMSMIRDNWKHYCDIYGIRRSHYRNDFALSVALGTVHGHNPHIDHLPFALASVMPSHSLTQIDTDQYRVDWFDQERRPRWIAIKDMDFHAMGKAHLGAIVANTK